MLVGYNTNVPYKGVLYHVQTEDNGLRNPVIITLLYQKGVILASKKTSYADIAANPDYKERVRELMKEQHKDMMKRLIHGEFTEATDDAQKESGLGAEEETGDGDLQGPESTPPEAASSQNDEVGKEASKNDTAKGQITRSLDDILLDFIIKGGK